MASNNIKEKIRTKRHKTKEVAVLYIVSSDNNYVATNGHDF
jgi:hypothetical protein